MVRALEKSIFQKIEKWSQTYKYRFEIWRGQYYLFSRVMLCTNIVEVYSWDTEHICNTITRVNIENHLSKYCLHAFVVRGICNKFWNAVSAPFYF